MSQRKQCKQGAHVHLSVLKDDDAQGYVESSFRPVTIPRTHKVLYTFEHLSE